jgi:hypothetical protein
VFSNVNQSLTVTGSAVVSRVEQRLGIRKANTTITRLGMGEVSGVAVYVGADLHTYNNNRINLVNILTRAHDGSDGCDTVVSIYDTPI